MDQSYQLYLFMLSIATLFTDIKPTEVFSHNWFNAQAHCLDQGLTIKNDKSDKPYWTGVYRRLTPWISILGCYHDSFESLQDVTKITMIRSSVGLCQEICFQEIGYKFAVKMKNCLCIKSDIHVLPFYRRSPFECDVKCEDRTDDIYSGDCGGESTYNLYEIQRVNFNSEERCLSLDCSEEDTKLFPQECSEPLGTVCENMRTPSNSEDSGWSLSMEICKNSRPFNYLLGDVNLTYPHPTCSFLNHQSKLVWIGVVRQIYTSTNLGREIREEEQDTFLECQMCTENDCQFIRCSETLFGSIFCKSQTTAIFTTAHESFSALSFMSNHSTTKQLPVSESTTRHYDKDQLASINDKQQTSSGSDELALKIALPVITVFIILLLCAVAIVFYKRRRTMTKTDRTTNAEVEYGPRKNVDSDVDCVQNNTYFVLEQCPQYVSKGSDTSNESPYNNSEEGVYDHLRDKKSRKPEVEDTYQHASAVVSRDMSEYDTMANAVHKKQEEDVSYDYSHQDTNGNYACDLPAKHYLTDNPYDVAI